MLKDRVYDNGFAILGIVYNVKEYLCRYAEEIWEIEDVINRLEDLDETDIVVVNCENYNIEYFKQDSIVEV